MGTTYSIKYVGAGDQISDVSASVQSELEEVNRQMSTYLESSELSLFNASSSTDWYEVSAETMQVVALALQISETTGGAFDVTVAPLVDLWGFGPKTPPNKLLSEEAIRAAQSRVGYQRIQVQATPPALRKLNADLQVDLSAIAKGHGVDRVAKVLDQLGISNYFVEIGGETLTRGKKRDGTPWQIGIECPVEHARKIETVLPLSNLALATSGDYRNFYEIDGRRFSHTIDPRTGWPVQHSLASASVVADNCALADAIATSLMVLGTAEGMALAEKHHWAIMLMERTDSGYEISSSSEFRQLFPESSAVVAAQALK